MTTQADKDWLVANASAGKDKATGCNESALAQTYSTALSQANAIVPTTPPAGGESPQGTTCTPLKGSVRAAGHDFTLTQSCYIRRDGVAMPASWPASQSVAATLLMWDHQLWYSDANATERWRTIDPMSGALGPVTIDPRGADILPPETPDVPIEPGPSAFSTVYTTCDTVDHARTVCNATSVRAIARGNWNEYAGGLQGAPVQCHGLFRIDGVAGKAPVVQYTAVDQVGAPWWYSVGNPDDPSSWVQMPEGSVEVLADCIQFKLPTLSAGTVYVASGPPARWGYVSAFINALPKSLVAVVPNPSMTLPTTSATGVPIAAYPLQWLRIGIGPKLGFVLGGLHSGEWGGPHAAVGWVNYLASSAASAMRSACTFHIMVLATPHGDAAGFERGAPEPPAGLQNVVDPNRHWVDPAGALDSVAKLRAYMLGIAGSKDFFVIDHHSLGKGTAATGIGYELYYSGASAARFCELFNAAGYGGGAQSPCIADKGGMCALLGKKLGVTPEITRGIGCSAKVANDYGAGVAKIVGTMLAEGSL